jgi:FtsZ-interacting cell division protein ZipA
MKVSNTVVSVIVVAAVLVFAYGVGLLIRQARTGGSHGPVSADVNNTTSSRRTGPGTAGAKDTPEERARVKEAKAQAIEKMNSLTEEEKEKFRSQVTKKVGGRRGGKGRQNLSPQERQAQTIQTPTQPESGHPQDANTPASQGETPATKPSTDKGSSEPGKAGPG